MHSLDHDVHGVPPAKQVPPAAAAFTFMHLRVPQIRQSSLLWQNSASTFLKPRVASTQTTTTHPPHPPYPKNTHLTTMSMASLHPNRCRPLQPPCPLAPSLFTHSPSRPAVWLETETQTPSHSQSVLLQQKICCYSQTNTTHRTQPHWGMTPSLQTRTKDALTSTTMSMATLQPNRCRLLQMPSHSAIFLSFEQTTLLLQSVDHSHTQDTHMWPSIQTRTKAALT
jgi:hypothetical protein